MKRVKLALVAGVSLLAVTLAATPAAAAPDPAPQAGAAKTVKLKELDPGLALGADCQFGYSCYYDSQTWTGHLFTAGRCGEHDLMGGIYQNKISSIANRGNGDVHVYRWTAGGWEYMNTTPIGYYTYFTGGWENEIDLIYIDC